MFFNPIGTTTRQKLDHLIFMLSCTYGLLYIAIGADKFINMVTFWPKYFSITILQLIPLPSAIIISVVGLIEIALGLMVLTKWQKLGAQLMVLWFLVVIVNFLTMGTVYLDIAARDAVMAVGTLALVWLIDIRNQS